MSALPPLTHEASTIRGECRPDPGTWPSTGRHRRHTPLLLLPVFGSVPFSLWQAEEHEREGATLSRTWPEKLGLPRRGSRTSRVLPLPQSSSVLMFWDSSHQVWECPQHLSSSAAWSRGLLSLLGAGTSPHSWRGLQVVAGPVGPLRGLPVGRPWRGPKGTTWIPPPSWPTKEVLGRLLEGPTSDVLAGLSLRSFRTPGAGRCRGKPRRAGHLCHPPCPRMFGNCTAISLTTSRSDRCWALVPSVPPPILHVVSGGLLSPSKGCPQRS